jgi:hypothetical protein
MVLHKLIVTLGFAALGIGPANSQPARTTAAQAAAAFPCPTGDASCGNGDKAGAKKAKHRKSSAQNDLPDSNPNQKIEGASGPVDQGVTSDLREMNREGGTHPVNRPK